MDIKRGSNTSTTDRVVVVLTDDHGNRLRSYETTLTGSSTSSWKSFEIKFNTNVTSKFGANKDANVPLVSHQGSTKTP